MQTQTDMMDNIKKIHEQRYYTEKFTTATAQLLQSLQELNQHLDVVTTESTQAPKVVSNLMTDLVNQIGELTQAIETVKNIDCPPGLALLSQQEKALMTVCKDVDAIQQLLIDTVALLDSDNDSECYSICQPLQQYCATLEQACAAICRAANTFWLESVMQTEPCTKLIALNETLIQQLKNTYHQLSYRQAYQQTLMQVQQKLQALIQYIGVHATEEAFVENIYNKIVFTVLMDAIIKHVGALVDAMKNLNNIEIPAGLELLSHQKKGLARMADEIAMIQQSMIENYTQYGMYNYSEGYGIYQKLQQYFNMVEAECALICKVADIAKLEKLLRKGNNYYQKITGLREELIQESVTKDIESNDETQPAPTADAVDIREVTIVRDESQDARSQACAGVIIKEVTIINESAGAPSTQLDISQFDTWGKHTENFIQTLPSEMLKLFADYLDPVNLFPLTIANKKSARELLSTLQKKQQSLSIFANKYAKFLYTSQAIYMFSGDKDNKQEQPYFSRLSLEGLTGKILQVVATLDSIFVLTTTGLYGQWRNANGELELGQKNNQPFFTRITCIEGDIKEVIAGKELIAESFHDYVFVLTTKGLYKRVSLGQEYAEDQLTFNLLPGTQGEILQVMVEDHTARTFVLSTTALYGCERNSSGQLVVTETINTRDASTRKNGIEGEILQVIAGQGRIFILTTTGLYGSGDNTNGQLGLEKEQQQRDFTLIPGVVGEVLQIVIIDFSNSLLLTTEGLYGSGNNIFGKLSLDEVKQPGNFTSALGTVRNVLQLIIKNSPGSFANNGLVRQASFHTFKKIELPYLDYYKKIYSQRPMLQAVLKEKVYAQPVESYDEIEAKKQQALEVLQADINNAVSLQALFYLYSAVKQAETGVLRVHDKNIIPTFGDTDAYKQALTYFIGQLQKISKLDTFVSLGLNERNQLHLILFEAWRCQLLVEDWATCLFHNIKILAAGVFQVELAEKNSLAGILNLFDSINVQKPHGKNHILRYQSESNDILLTYDNTSAYTKALFDLAQKAADTAFPISDNQAEKETQLQLLKQLKENLQDVKPYFNKEWQALVDKLEQKIVQADVNAENTESSSYAAVMRLAG